MCGKWHEDRRSEPPFSGPNFSRKSGLLPACETALSASNRLGALPPSNPPLPSQRLSWPLQHPSPVTGPIAAVLTCRKPLSSAMQTHSLTALEIALGASQIEKAIGLPSMPLNALGREAPSNALDFQSHLWIIHWADQTPREPHAIENFRSYLSHFLTYKRGLGFLTTRCSVMLPKTEQRVWMYMDPA